MNIPEEYKKYYEEGKAALIPGKNVECPYSPRGEPFPSEIWSAYQNWLIGYRDAKKEYALSKYDFDGFKKELKDLETKYNLKIESDYDGCMFLKTPEGYEYEI